MTRAGHNEALGRAARYSLCAVYAKFDQLDETTGLVSKKGNDCPLTPGLHPQASCMSPIAFVGPVDECVRTRGAAYPTLAVLDITEIKPLDKVWARLALLNFANAS
eukprot:6176683-Pleurochrysis_carterae.AAC.1